MYRIGFSPVLLHSPPLSHQPTNTAVGVESQKCCCVIGLSLDSRLYLSLVAWETSQKSITWSLSVVSESTMSPQTIITVLTHRLLWAACAPRTFYDKLWKHELPFRIFRLARSDWDCYQVLEKWSGHGLCLEPKKCLRENLEIANARTFPEVHRCSLQILEVCQELNFILGAPYQQTDNDQESTLNMWFAVNKVLKAPLFVILIIDYSMILSPTPRPCWIALISSRVLNVETDV